MTDKEFTAIDPQHYRTGKFECIEVMEEALGRDAVRSFCLCNAFKYIYRHKRKNGDEDIKKAQWYINKYLELSDELTLVEDKKEEIVNEYKFAEGDEVVICRENDSRFNQCGTIIVRYTNFENKKRYTIKFKDRCEYLYNECDLELYSEPDKSCTDEFKFKVGDKVRLAGTSYDNDTTSYGVILECLPEYYSVEWKDTGYIGTYVESNLVLYSEPEKSCTDCINDHKFNVHDNVEYKGQKAIVSYTWYDKNNKEWLYVIRFVNNEFMAVYEHELKPFVSENDVIRKVGEMAEEERWELDPIGCVEKDVKDNQYTWKKRRNLCLILQKKLKMKTSLSKVMKLLYVKKMI